MKKAPDCDTEKSGRALARLAEQSQETPALSHISSEITPLALTASEPPGSFWLGPSQHRRRAMQLEANNPTSRAAMLAKLVARAIEKRLRETVQRGGR
jgi:hypothetical protein